MTFVRAIGRGAVAGFTWLFTGGRWKLAAIALTAILTAFLIFTVHKRGQEIDALNEKVAAREGEIALLNQAREADSKAMAGNAQAKTIITRSEVIGRARTDAALARSPEWANEPVPVGIIDSLRE